MGAAAISLMAFAIVIATAFTVMSDVIGITASGSEGLRVTWNQAETLANSSVNVVSASSASTDVDIVIENVGKIKYVPQEMSDWEVIIRYRDGGGVERVEYLTFASTIATGSWVVQQIYLDYTGATNEIYEPGILNSTEEMVLRGRLSNAPGASTTGMVTVVTPEGGRSTTLFSS